MVSGAGKLDVELLIRLVELNVRTELLLNDQLDVDFLEKDLPSESRRTIYRVPPRQT